MIQRVFVGAVLAVSLFAASGANATSTVWSQKDDFVRIEAGDGAKATPGHVPPISPDTVKAIFSSIKLTGDGSTTEFLDEDQLALVAGPISRALQSAGPGEDVTFAVHLVSIMSVIGPPKTSAGRIFIDGDSVGVIVGMAQESYTSGWLSLDPSKIHTGSRAAPQQTKWRVQPNGYIQYAKADRGDWVKVSPALWLGNYAAAPAAPAQMAPAYAPVQPAAAPMPAPLPAATPMAVAPPAPPPGIEERFAILKRLHDEHMITDSEYEKSKASLLDGLTNVPR